jgi:septum site-determining protein MinD
MEGLLMGETIVITSGKGGVGKTTTTANIGTALAKLDKTVVVVDGDTGLRNLDVLMGLENRVVYNIIDVFENRCRLKQALIKDKRFENLYLLPTAQCRDKKDVKSEDMLNITNELKKEFDYVLIDCPAGIEQGFENAVIGADRAIVVVNPEITSVRDADRVIGKLDSNGLSNHGLIVNRMNIKMSQRRQMLGVDDIVECLAIKLIGIVPEDKNVTICTNKGEPVALDHKASAGQAFNNIARRIVGIEVPLEYKESNQSGIFNSLKNLFKSR